MFDKNIPGPSQNVSGNSTAVQANRDVNFQIIQAGLTLADVQTAFGFLLENNFPRLQEAARLAAEQHVKEFAETFAKEVHKDAAKVLVDKFSDPDVQAAMNDAVDACARRGIDANPDVLSRLLVHRMSDNTPFIDMVLNEAVHVAPKLSKQQLGFLVFAHTCRSVTLGIPSYPALKELGDHLLPIIRPGFGLSHPQKLHMEYAGVITINTLVSSNIFQGLFDLYGKQLDLKTADEFKESMRLRCPAYYAILEKFEENKIYEINLTSVGLAISITLMKKVFPVEFSLWLN